MTDAKQVNPGDYVDDLIDPTPSPLQPFMCVVSAELFLRAWQGRSTEKERPHLHGVYIEPCPDGGAILTATNGKILISIRDPFALVKGSAIVTLNELMIRACKPKKSDIDVTERALLINSEGEGRADGIALAEAIVAHVFAADPDLSRDNAMALFAEPSDQICAAQYGELIVNAEFPSWRGVLPRFGDTPGASGACHDAQLCKPLIAALTAPGGKMTPLSWFTYDRDPTHAPQLVKPYPFNLYRHDAPFEGFAIVMPINTESTISVPAWATRD